MRKCVKGMACGGTCIPKSHNCPSERRGEPAKKLDNMVGVINQSANVTGRW
jgi:hypothetical protein